MNLRVLLWGGVASLALVLFLGLGFRSDPRRIDSPLIGKPAPEFGLIDLEGRPLGLEELRGRPVVLNFWATWCQPCLVEHPVFLAAARRYEGRVHFVGVVYQDETSRIRRFVATRGAWGPVLLDPDVRTAIAYGVYGVPETFFIAADGTIVEKVTAPVDRRLLDRIVENLL